MPAINVAKRKRAAQIANAINSIEGVPVSKKASKQAIYKELLFSKIIDFNKRNHLPPIS